MQSTRYKECPRACFVLPQKFTLQKDHTKDHIKVIQIKLSSNQSKNMAKILTKTYIYFYFCK